MLSRFHYAISLRFSPCTHITTADITLPAITLMLIAMPPLLIRH
jgi:hypothetical protein